MHSGSQLCYTSLQSDLARSTMRQWSEANAGICNNEALLDFDKFDEKAATTVQNVSLN